MIHIAFTIDDKFVVPCAVSMKSIICHTSDTVIFYIVGLRLSADSVQQLCSFDDGCRIRVKIVPVNATLLDDFEVRAMRRRISLATFLRCLLARLLPPEVDKVIYLDSDLLVLDDIARLYRIDIHDVAMAGVRDRCAHEPGFYARLGYDTAYSYVNAGVLLINLAYWREHEVTPMLIDYYRAHAEQMLFNDQDLLNAVFYDRKRLLDLKWNVQDGFFLSALPHWFFAPHDAYVQMLIHPSILHYTNRKPWEYHCMHPLRHIYLHYACKVPFARTSIIRRKWQALHRRWHLLPYTCGIKRSKYLDLHHIRLQKATK